MLQTRTDTRKTNDSCHCDTLRLWLVAPTGRASPHGTDGEAQDGKAQDGEEGEAQDWSVRDLSCLPIGRDRACHSFTILITHQLSRTKSQQQQRLATLIVVCVRIIFEAVPPEEDE